MRERLKRRKQPSVRLWIHLSVACNKVAFKIIPSLSLKAQSLSVPSQKMIHGSQPLRLSQPRVALSPKDKIYAGGFRNATLLLHAILSRPLSRGVISHRMLWFLPSRAPLLPLQREKRTARDESMDRRFLLLGPTAMGHRQEKVEEDRPTNPQHRDPFRPFKLSKVESRHRSLQILFPNLLLIPWVTTALHHPSLVRNMPSHPLQINPVDLVNFSCRSPNTWVPRYGLLPLRQSW